MTSFRAKIGRYRMRKKENKNYSSVPFLPEAEQKIPKNQLKNAKNEKKYHYGFISSQNRLENDEKERK